jgi:dienelactone hydrolase
MNAVQASRRAGVNRLAHRVAGQTRRGTEWLPRTGAVAALACLAGVVFDSPLGTVGRAVGLTIALAGALMAIRLESMGPRWRSLAELGTGTAGVSVGLGYGVPRLAEGSLGLGVLAVGASLISLPVLAAGAIRALRLMRDWRRLLAVPAAFVWFQFVLLPVTTGTLGMHGWRVPVSGDPPLGASTVSFKAADGVQLGGWYLAGRNGAAVVLLPGAGSPRSSTIGHFEALVGLGYGVLAIDARGTGDSGGYNNLWGWDGTTDIAAAVDWLRRDAGIPSGRIALVGISMGGEQSITALPDLPAVGAVVSEGVQSRVPADLWYVQDGLRGWIERAVASLRWGVADLWTDASPPISLRQASERQGGTPILLIAADSADERAVAADLAERSPAVTVWQTVGIGHTGALLADRAEWSRRVGAFLDRALVAGS